MTFALPIALALTALALPIIGFYILRVRLRRIPVSTNLFWNQIFDEKPPRSLWQNFRHLLSLLMQLLMLGLLVLSIADPYFPWQLLHARRVVLVVDPSASMRATDIVPSRLDAARKEAHALIASLRFRDEMAIIVAGKHPQVLVGMTNHVPTLKRALNSIVNLDGPTHIQGSIELGKQLIGNHPHGQVLVFTDGCFDLKFPPNPDDKPSQEITEIPQTRDTDQTQVSYRIFGSETSNLGITQLQVRRSLIDPVGYEALISVKNASQHIMKCRLELSLNDVPIDVLPLELKPMEQWSRAIEKTSLAGGLFFAELTQIRKADESATSPTSTSLQANESQSKSGEFSGNGLTTDDRAWAILSERKMQKVLIVSAGNLFLHKVFQANPLVQISLMKEPPERWPADTIVVLHGNVPTTLPPGPLFVIDPNNTCDAWTIGDPLENPIITEQDKSSPLMTHIRLDNVLMPQTKQIQFIKSFHALAKTISNDVVYAEVKRPNGKCLVLTVNLEQSDLAFRTAFPVLVTNALSWFAGQTGEMNESVQAGSSISVRFESVPNEKHIEYEIRSPQNVSFPFHAFSNIAAMDNRSEPGIVSTESRVVKSDSTSEQESSSWIHGHVGPLNEIGIWRVVPKAAETDGKNTPTLFEIAVNLADTRETDLTPNEKLVEQQSQTLIAGWLSRPAWFYLVIVACALTAIEWFLYQRRLIT